MDNNADDFSNPKSITGYRPVLWKQVLVWIAILGTAGLFGLILLFGKRGWFLLLTHETVPLREATRVLLRIRDGTIYIENVTFLAAGLQRSDKDLPKLRRHQKKLYNEPTVGGKLDDDNKKVRLFNNRGLTYLYDESLTKFNDVIDMEAQIPLDLFDSARYNYVTAGDRKQKLAIFGPNDLYIPVPSFFTTMLMEVLNPFYAFQALSVTLWYVDGYDLYATCIVIISLLTLLKTTYDIRKNRHTLSQRLSSSPSAKFQPGQECFEQTSDGLAIDVSCEADAYITISPRNIVPGDIIRIPPYIDPANGYIVPCDAVLIRGSCMVNECMLTGESIPLVKSPVTNRDHRFTNDNNRRAPCDLYLNKQHHPKHVIFKGTKVIQTKIYGEDCVKAYVLSTGFQTTKGRMVLGFLYPKPNGFKFDQESNKFIGALFFLSLIGFTYSLILKIFQKVPISEIIIRSLDLITIVVPPALPAAMTIGMMFAQKRLKEYGILCIGPHHINACGVIDVMCFDKTGTLTEEGLDIWGLIAVVTLSNKSPENYTSLINIKPLASSINQQDVYFASEKIVEPIELLNHAQGESNLELSICTALCHSLTYVNGVILGDPLDTKMFKFSGWTMTDLNESCSLVTNLRAKLVDNIQTNPITCLASRGTVILQNGKCESVNDNTAHKLSINVDDILILGHFYHPIKNKSNHGHVVADNDKTLYEDSPFEYIVLHQYIFSPTLQRMSCIVTGLMSHQFKIFCKGAPEILKVLCRPESLPNDYNERLKTLTSQGLRIIACASKPLVGFKLNDLRDVQRDEVEKDLTFLGFLIFQNKLKERSRETIRTIQSANIKTIMITGDNILTALSVAKNCHIIPKVCTDICIVEANIDPMDCTKLLINFNSNATSYKPDSIYEMGNESHSTHLRKSRKDKYKLFCKKVMSLVHSKNSMSSENVNKIISSHTLENINENDEETKNEKKSKTIFAITGSTFDNLNLFGKRTATVNLSVNIEADNQTSGISTDLNQRYVSKFNKGDRRMPEHGARSHLWLNKLNNISHNAKGGEMCPRFLLDYLLTDQCLVFARMNPAQKTRLIQAYQSLDYFVGMCGDGANDCGALKSAHMGISLSNNGGDFSSTCAKPDGKMSCAVGHEASLAAPFTSDCGDISCVPHVIREGRASLVTSFGVFKSLACYSLNQFLAVLILYWISTNFSDMEFAYADFFPATLLTMLMGYTKSFPRLVGRHKPASSLAELTNMASVIGHICINLIFIMIAFLWTKTKPWSTPSDPEWDPKNENFPHVVTAFFIITIFQYISFPVLFSSGPPFRKSFYTNLPFLISSIVLILITLYFSLGRPYSLPIAKYFKFRYPPNIWSSLFYLILVSVNILAATLFETIIIGRWISPILQNRDLMLRKKKPRHDVISKIGLNATHIENSLRDRNVINIPKTSKL